MRHSLSSLRILLYLDDFAILSDEFEQHLSDLRALLTKMREFGLRVNRDKCSFVCPSLKYLGHVISANGIEPDPDKTRAIGEMAAPQSVKQLLSFIATCSWFRRFIPNFAKIAEPLTRLTKKATKWSWETEQQKAFDELKKALTSSPILMQADDSRPFMLRTDASSFAIGAVLLQGETGEEHPIEYASRLLTSAERNYSTSEREALAVVWAVEKFRGYIEGTHVTILSDHQALRWLMSLKTPTGRLARWALRL